MSSSALAPEVVISYNQIIPAPLQDELILIRDTTTASSFRTGDIRNQLIKKYQGQYTQKEIEGAVGYFAGKRARTVRYYGEVAVKISPGLRQQFHNLSFAHFAYVAPLNRAAKITCLQWASDHSASVDMLEAEYGKQQGLPKPDRLEFNTLPQLFSGFTTHLWRWAQNNLPKDKHPALKAILSELAKILAGE